MLEIRDEQMAVLEQTAHKTFEDEMVRHLAEFVPQQCEVIGERQVRKVIQFGIARAEKHGLTNRGPVRFYIELIFVFGSEFDTDPLLPWAAEILGDMLTNQMAKAGRLFEKTSDYLEKVSGSNKEHTKAALSRAAGQRFEDFPSFGKDFEKEMLIRLKTNHPQKCDYVGDTALRTLISRGTKVAEKHAISTGQGTAVVICLMFALGHGCAADPHLPWIESTLHNAAISDPHKRVERLYAKTMTYLKHALARGGQS